MKLVMFCDYGLDDAAATVDVFMHAAEDGYDEVDIVPVGGNVPTEIALRNAMKLVGNLSKVMCLPKVTIVDTTAYSQPSEFLQAIHGMDGMGDLFPDVPCPVPVVGFSKWLYLLKPGFELFSSGPMTMVPYVLEKGPCRFIFMGGNVAEIPNYHGYEFNHGINPAAFAQCVRFTHVAITMDTCRNALFNIQERKVPEGDILHMIARRDQELSFSRGEMGCYTWDDIAVKYMRHPEWFILYEAYDPQGNLLHVAKYMQNRTYVEILDE